MPKTKKTTTKKNSSQNLEEDVRKRAYEISQERGKGDGDELSDWLKAEKEIKAKKKTTKKK